MSGFRDKNLENEIFNLGGRVTTSVSNNTTILIVKDKNKLGAKIQKAISLGIPIYVREEFLNKYKISLD
jgi:NAD-dependent DNA ligase